MVQADDPFLGGLGLSMPGNFTNPSALAAADMVGLTFETTERQRSGTDGATTLSDKSSVRSLAWQRFKRLVDLDRSLGRSPAPSSDHFREKMQWLLNVADRSSESIVVRDRTIVDHFLSLYENHVAPWPTWSTENICVTEETPEEWYLGLAALGGLFCPAQGSRLVALHLANQARRKLLAHVSSVTTFWTMAEILRYTHRKQNLSVARTLS